MTALLFPGQAVQRVGMGSALLHAFPEAAHSLQQSGAESGRDDLEALVRRGPLSALTRTENAQLAVTAVSLAALAVLRARGIRYDCVAGHSVGLLAALCAADALTPGEAARAAACRGALMGALPTGGTMLSLLGPEPQVVAALAARIAAETGLPVGLGLVNGPRAVIVSGAAAAVSRVAALAAGKSVTATPLEVSHAFHSPLMAPAVPEWSRQVEALPLRRTTVPVIADLDGRMLRDPDELRTLLVDQLAAPVRWDLVCERLVAAGVTEAVECADSKVLRAFAAAYPALHVTTMHAPAVLAHLRRHGSLPVACASAVST